MTEKYCNNPTTANEITDHYPAIQLTIEIYTNGHKKYIIVNNHCTIIINLLFQTIVHMDIKKIYIKHIL